MTNSITEAISLLNDVKANIIQNPKMISKSSKDDSVEKLKLVSVVLYSKWLGYKQTFVPKKSFWDTLAFWKPETKHPFEYEISVLDTAMADVKTTIQCLNDIPHNKFLNVVEKATVSKMVGDIIHITVCLGDIE